MKSATLFLTRAVLVACVVLAACKKAAPAAYPPPDVTVLTVKPEQVEAKLDYVGQAEASKAVEVRSQITGVIVSRPYTEGTDVAQGTVLYRIDPTTYEAALRSAPPRVCSAGAPNEDRPSQSITMARVGYRTDGDRSHRQADAADSEAAK